MQHQEETWPLYSCDFVPLTLILLLHYLVKCRSCTLAVYNNELILGSTSCIGSEDHRDHR